jgi:hypothetical protein
MHYVVYDLEIVNAIPPKTEADRLPGVTYCEGWGDHANMGISVMCAYDSKDNAFRVFGQDNLAEFNNIIQDSLMVGFNNLNFDNKVLKANGIEMPGGDQHYDILQEIWAAAGSRGGYGLDAMARANLNEGKSGNGATAPILWQRGSYARVADYCIRDVILTLKLFRILREKASLVDPKSFGEIQMRDPTEVWNEFQNKRGGREIQQGGANRNSPDGAGG